MVESKTCSVLPLENLRAIQCMRRLSLSRSIIDTYKYQNRVLKTFYYNLNHIEETEMDDQDQLLIDQLANQGKVVFHIFQSRGMVEFDPNERDWFIRRAYVFIERDNDKINMIRHDEISQGVIDAFVICDPVSPQIGGKLADGFFTSISLTKIKNLKGEGKIIWSFDAH